MHKLFMLMLVLTATSANAGDHRWNNHHHHNNQYERDPDKPHWRGDTNHQRDQYGNRRWPQGQYSGNGSGDYYQPEAQRGTTTCVVVNGGTSICV